jgi:ATP-dependent exoDNAse (exonuclease V) beta subunit
MNDAVRWPDSAERERALDPGRSYIVQAPAGSGKTELLIQRYLALLGRVERPEEIAAITFTIKAAAQMRLRVFAALAAARDEPRPDAPHEARTWDLARAALGRNDALGWKLEESAERLRVQTIDALCASLTRQMPVLSQFGGQPEVIEDASALFGEAARNLLARLDEDASPVAGHVARLLTHLDNDAARAQDLIATMLAQRDHWIRTLRKPSDRASLEAALDEVRRAAVDGARALWPPGLVSPHEDDVDAWIRHAGGYLTDKGEWRKRPPTPDVLRENEALQAALFAVKKLPAARYSDAQWEVLEAILELAPLAVAELRLVFAKHGKADFIEFAQGALRALEGEDGPTDLMLVLDYRIRHILVDEFQDTSQSQFELLEKLTSGWEPGDGRTLFVVGDPMQSIYRFREAEVGRFLLAWHEGIGGVALERLTLSANFRSQAGIVDWVNASFSQVMPQTEDIHGGAVTYSPSHAVHPADDEAVIVHAFFDADAAGEGRRVAEVAAAALAGPRRDPGKPASVAILVRNRNHLLQILPRLREARLAFRAVEIESLGHRPAVQDLLALTRALSHLADRTAWLAVLRAPWCGLTLADLLVLGPGEERLTVWEAMRDAARLETLTADGRMRLERTGEILGRALAGRRRASLRDAVEGAWLALGGPACAEGDTDLEDAEIYFEHLESAEEAGALGDLAAFEESVANLFALPDLAAPECLQVMTIHKAKGLEFDTVIVPGLAAGTGRDERKLFLWMETPESSLLLAPINPAGEKGDPIYELIRGLDKRKAEHEMGRLLYVAATRARRRLHLLGDAKRDPEGVAKAPPKGSLLAKLWPVVGDRFAIEGARRAAAAESAAVVPHMQGALRRLGVGKLEYEMPAAVPWAAAPEARVYDEIEFSWVGDTARRVGSVVHRWLQRIAEEEAKGWNRARIEKERDAIRNELAARGVVEDDLDEACARVIAALAASLDDPRGRWLLGPQRNARNEYRISTVIDGARRILVIDRLFEDLAGAWIVDYKTSSHEGADVERFLAAEEERYRAQLERYAAALGMEGARRGLYFPLLKGWREWSGTEGSES